LALTAITTGWQTYQLILWGVWGKPPNLLESVALFAAFIVFLGALMALASPKAGAVIAAIGCFMAWLFYGPALWNTIALSGTGQYSLDPCAFFPPALLAASSVWVVVVLCRRESQVRDDGSQAGQSRTEG
jgi:hypothetical protein